MIKPYILLDLVRTGKVDSQFLITCLQHFHPTASKLIIAITDHVHKCFDVDDRLAII